MGMKAWERWAPITGVLFVAAYVIAFLVAGEPPKADAGAGAIRDYFADDAAVLTGTYLLGIALFFYLSYVGTLATRIREAGEQRLAAVAFGAAITIASIQLIGIVANAVMAYRTPVDDGVLQAIYDTQLLAFTLTAFPAALLVGAIAVASARTGLLPAWFNALAGLAGIAFLVGGGTYAADGFFAPGGTYVLLTTIVFMAWAAASSAILLAQAQAAEAPRPATAAM